MPPSNLRISGGATAREEARSARRTSTALEGRLTVLEEEVASLRTLVAALVDLLIEVGLMTEGEVPQ